MSNVHTAGGLARQLAHFPDTLMQPGQFHLRSTYSAASERRLMAEVLLHALAGLEEDAEEHAAVLRWVDGAQARCPFGLVASAFKWDTDALRAAIHGYAATARPRLTAREARVRRRRRGRES